MSDSTPIYHRLATLGIIREIDGIPFTFAHALDGNGQVYCSVVLHSNDAQWITHPDYLSALNHAIDAVNVLNALDVIRRIKYRFDEVVSQYEDSGLERSLTMALRLETQTWWNIDDFGENFSATIQEFINAAQNEKKRRAPTPPRVRDLHGFVYLLKSPSKALYKIGYSAKPDNRLATFENKLPFSVQYVCLIESDDMRGLEKKLHKKFADRRTSGEWFKLTATDVAYIIALSNGVSMEDLESGRYLLGGDNLPLFGDTD